MVTISTALTKAIQIILWLLACYIISHYQTGFVFYLYYMGIGNLKVKHKHKTQLVNFYFSNIFKELLRQKETKFVDYQSYLILDNCGCFFTHAILRFVKIILFHILLHERTKKSC